MLNLHSLIGKIAFSAEEVWSRLSRRRRLSAYFDATALLVCLDFLLVRDTGFVVSDLAISFCLLLCILEVIAFHHSMRRKRMGSIRK